jgi:hypothetical protein
MEERVNRESRTGFLLLRPPHNWRQTEAEQANKMPAIYFKQHKQIICVIISLQHDEGTAV